MPTRGCILSIALITTFLMCMAPALQATHIVGAELTYECLNVGTNSYRFRLRLLRDCLLGEAPFDEVVHLYAFSTLNPANFRVFDILKPSSTPELIPTQWNQCVGTPYNLCVEEAIYVSDITLQPATGGWDFAWARCCRNSNIDNLFNPLNQGVTFVAHMPGPEEATCNSMPTFNNQMPTFICVDEDYYFDHSATDIDGDSLVYRLSRPYTGLNAFGQGAGNPQFGGPPPQIDNSNFMGPPPYVFVTYNGPSYNANNPFGPGTAGINPQSGWVHFVPPSVGVYVIAVSVFEYRDGILLSENKKDLQVHVIQCLPQNEPPVISHIFNPTDIVIGDTIIISTLDTACYRVEVYDPDSGVVNVQPISAIFSGAAAPSISISGTNPLVVDICWESNCDFAGGLVEIILMGYDADNCPIYNPAFDTVYVRIEPPADARPVVDHLLPLPHPLGPDTFYVEVDAPACFTAWVVDSSGINGPESHVLTLEAMTGVQIFNVTYIEDASDPDSLAIQVCFTPGCDNSEQLYRLVIQGSLDAACPPANTRNDTVFILVAAIPNPPPAVNADLSLVPDLNGDTILVEVHDMACFQFSVNDTFPGLGLTQSVTLEAVQGGSGTGIPPDVQVVSTQDSLLMDVCWFPICDNVGGLYRLVLAGTQLNHCGQSASDADTVYVRVRDAINSPPVFNVAIQPGYSFSGDTLLLTPDSLGCFDFVLSDTGDNTYLEVEVVVTALGVPQQGVQVSVDFLSSQPDSLTGVVCVTPGCFFVDQTLLLEFIGRDTFDCNPSNWVRDSAYVRVVLPYNNPPVIRHDLSGLPSAGGVVTVTPRGEPFCYLVELEDPDSLYADLTAEGVSYVFDTWFRYGNPGEVTVSGTNPLQVQVCWAPSCYDSGESFELVICGRDTSRCGLTPTVCDTVVFTIAECNIEVQNVFSPNGDGINDDFIPFNDAGVEYYRLNIFDRWGRQVFAGENGRWNGRMNGDGGEVPVGVYYFIFEYKFYSARGVPLKERSVGYLTLLR